jgi:hypothetical protein
MELDQELTRRLLKSREWSIAGKAHLYGRNSGITRMDVYFALKRGYAKARRVPVLGPVALASAAVWRGAKSVVRKR